MFEPVIDFIRERYHGAATVALHEPVLGQAEKDAMSAVIDSGFVSSVGAAVTAFEHRIAELTGTTHGVAVVNGTAGLTLALRIIGAEPGDMVITQAFTFVATANAVSTLGAVPAFIDIDKDTLGMSPASLEAFLTEQATMENGSPVHTETGRRIAACVPMHTFGHPARIDDIVAVCDRFGVPVVEDAAEAIGSSYKGKPLGGFGRVGVVSFNGNKIITTGGGGCLVTDDEALAVRGKHLSTTAKTDVPYEFVHDDIAYNFRMPNLNAALGIAQLDRLVGLLERKRALAKAYRDFFAAFDGVSFVEEPRDAVSNYWLNAVVMDDPSMRNAFLAELNDAGLMCRAAWRPMHRLPMYASAPRTDMTVTDDMYARLVNIPSGIPIIDLNPEEAR